MNAKKTILIIVAAIFLTFSSNAAVTSDDVWHKVPDEYLNIGDGVTVQHMLPFSNAIRDNMGVGVAVGLALFFTLLVTKLVAKSLKKVLRVEHYGADLDTMVVNIGKGHGKHGISVTGESRGKQERFQSSPGLSSPFHSPRHTGARKSALIAHILSNRASSAGAEALLDTDSSGITPFTSLSPAQKEARLAKGTNHSVVPAYMQTSEYRKTHSHLDISVDE